MIQKAWGKYCVNEGHLTKCPGGRGRSSGICPFPATTIWKETNGVFDCIMILKAFGRLGLLY